MAHGYHTLQNWNQWLTQHFLGNQVHGAEKTYLEALLKKHFGKHALLLGVPAQADLLEATTIPYHALLTPLIHQKHQANLIEGDLQKLPILTGSIDLVMMPHTLELVEHPRQLLAEACRIVKPEGLIVLSGFNPYSFWGMRKLLTNPKTAPWKLNFLQPALIKNWLKLADFKMEKHSSICFRPPINHPVWFERFEWIEKVGNQCLPLFGGVYVLVARAKVIPLTPIRLKWKQPLNGLRITNGMPGHIARQSK